MQRNMWANNLYTLLFVSVFFFLIHSIVGIVSASRVYPLWGNEADWPSKVCENNVVSLAFHIHMMVCWPCLCHSVLNVKISECSAAEVSTIPMDIWSTIVCLSSTTWRCIWDFPIIEVETSLAFLSLLSTF